MMKRELTAENMKAVVGGSNILGKPSCVKSRERKAKETSDDTPATLSDWDKAKLVASAIWTKLFD